MQGRRGSSMEAGRWNAEHRKERENYRQCHLEVSSDGHVLLVQLSVSSGTIAYLELGLNALAPTGQDGCA